MKGLKIIGEKTPAREFMISGVLITLMFICVTCELKIEQDESVTYYEDYDLSITRYFELNTERFSILDAILDTTGLDHLFKANGNYTFLAPTDDAFEAYFQEKGKYSYMDFQIDELLELIKYHIFEARYLVSNFKMGIIGNKTLSGDYMVSGPSIDGTDIFFNKNAKIISKDNLLPNGIIHEIDKVLEKPETTIYDWLRENQADYSIFLEALEKTGLNQLSTEQDSSDVFYSCFVTPDSKYIESNINSFDELAQRISPDDDDYTNPSNLLWGYIGSHFIKEVLSTSDAKEEDAFFGSLGGATIKYSLRPNTAEIVLNYHTSDFPLGLDIDEFNSNNLNANGIVHIMDTLFLTTSTFTRHNLVFLWLDVPGFPYDSIYQRNVDLYIANQYDEELDRYWPPKLVANHLCFDCTDGWLTLNAPYSGYLGLDHHRVRQWRDPQEELYDMGQPAFFNYEKCEDLLDITRKLPYIIPGKYKLFHYTKVGPERPTVRHYFDGKPVGGIKNLTTGIDFQRVELGIVDIEEGVSEHFFRVKMVTIGNGFHVAIILEPVD